MTRQRSATLRACDLSLEKAICPRVEIDGPLRPCAASPAEISVKPWFLPHAWHRCLWLAMRTVPLLLIGAGVTVFQTSMSWLGTVDQRLWRSETATPRASTPNRRR